MQPDITLRGEKVSVKTCTIELWHELYRNYVPNPMMDTTPYTYDYEKAEKAFYTRTADVTRLYFVIILNSKVIGDIYLKHINQDEKTAEFGVALIDDSVKGKGYGTEAIILLLNYAFERLNLITIFADSVLRNTRSQHVLEKIGFVFTHKDSDFFYYKLDRKLFLKVYPCSNDIKSKT